MIIEIQGGGTALLLLVNPHIWQSNGTVHPSYMNYRLKRRRFVAGYFQPIIQQYESTTFMEHSNASKILCNEWKPSCAYYDTFCSEQTTDER